MNDDGGYTYVYIFNDPRIYFRWVIITIFMTYQLFLCIFLLIFDQLSSMLVIFILLLLLLFHHHLTIFYFLYMLFLFTWILLIYLYYFYWFNIFFIYLFLNMFSFAGTLMFLLFYLFLMGREFSQSHEIRVQSQLSYQRLKRCYLMPPCLTLGITGYGSRISRTIQWKE